MSEIVFCVSFVVAGLGWLVSFRSRLPWGLLMFMAWPMGCLAWTLTTLATLAAGGTEWWVLGTHILSTAIALLLGFKASGHIFLRKLAWLIVLTALITLLSILGRATQGSYDSFELVSLGKALVMLGFRNGVASVLASWGVLVPIVHGAAVLARVDAMSSIQMLYFVSLGGVFAVGISRGIRLVAGTSPVRHTALFTAAALGLLGTTYLMLFQAFYIHNSLPSATYLLIYFVALLMARDESDPRALWLAVLSLLGFTLCRTEAILFACLAICMGAYLLESVELVRRFANSLRSYALVVGLWYLGLANVIGRGSDILTPSRAALQVALLVGVLLALTFVTQMRQFKKWLDQLPILFGIGSLLFAAGAIALKGPHFLKNFEMVIKNLSSTGRWEAGWGAAFLFALWSLATPSSRLRNAVLGFAAGFFVLVLTLGLFRSPYRLGWGDSANRIFTHLLPLLLMGLVAHLSGIRPADRTAQSDRRWSEGRVMGLTAIVSFFLFVPLAMAYLSPKNVAPSARIMSFPPACMANPKASIEFSEVFISDNQNVQRVVCIEAQNEIVVKLAESTRLQWISLEAPSPDERWSDFGIYVSADNINWKPVFDTRIAALQSNLKRISPVRIQIQSRTKQPTLYMRLVHRAPGARHDLALRRIEIYVKR